MVIAVLGVPPATGLLAPRLADDPARGVATAGRPCATYPGSLGQLHGRHDHVLATLVRARARVVAASATAATGVRQLQQAPYLALGGLRQRRDHADRLAAVTHPHQRRPCGAAVLMAPGGPPPRTPGRPVPLP